MPADPFVPFGGEHFVAIGIVLGAATALACAVRVATRGQPVGSARLDRAVRWALAVGGVGFLLFELAWLASEAEAWEIPVTHVLPLHLCDVSILIAPIVLLTANRYVFELLYFWGIGGALQAIATPTLGYGFPDTSCVLFFVGHGLILASAVYATVAMRLRPTPRSILRVWVLTNAYGLLIIQVNRVLGSNYLFLSHKPPTPSLLDVMGPWPWYWATLDVVALLVILLCYLPFFLLDRWRR